MLYIVTVRIDAAIADEWQAWMQDVQVPDVMDRGCFERYKGQFDAGRELLPVVQTWSEEEKP
jgi:hypothetical protein